MKLTKKQTDLIRTMANHAATHFKHHLNYVKKHGPDSSWTQGYLHGCAHGYQQATHFLASFFNFHNPKPKPQYKSPDHWRKFNASWNAAMDHQYEWDRANRTLRTTPGPKE